MELRGAMAMRSLVAFALSVVVAVRAQASTSVPLTINAMSTTTAPGAATAACAVSYMSSCISVAIIDVCGNINETSCVCGSSGQGQVATKAAPCLLASCPYNYLISIAGNAGSLCDEWLSTHTLTGSALLSAESAINAPHSAASLSTPASLTDSIILSTTASLTASKASDTSTRTSSPAAASASLPLAAAIGIGVGALSVACGAIAGIILCRRYKRKKRGAEEHAENTEPAEPAASPKPGPDPSELPTDANITELANKRHSALAIPPQELEGFHFPFRQAPGESGAVEAESRSVRAGQLPRGLMTGTETTAFDFETQKVLLTPAFIRTPGSRAESVSTTESGRRAKRPGTAGTVGASSTRSGPVDNTAPDS